MTRMRKMKKKKKMKTAIKSLCLQNWTVERLLHCVADLLMHHVLCVHRLKLLRFLYFILLKKY